MLRDFGIENRSSKRFQSRQRAFFVDPYQAARARDIRRQNSRQSPLYMIAAQDAPPRLGEIECSYSTIVGPCPAMRTSEMGQNRKSAGLSRMSVPTLRADVAGSPRHVRLVPISDIDHGWRLSQRGS
jgi:hypothetical protein